MFSLTQHSFDIIYLLNLDLHIFFREGLMMIPSESKHVAQG